MKKLFLLILLFIFLVYCKNQTEVSLVTINESGHVLYEGFQTDINTSKIALDFMRKFEK